MGGWEKPKHLEVCLPCERVKVGNRIEFGLALSLLQEYMVNPMLLEKLGSDECLSDPNGGSISLPRFHLVPYLRVSIVLPFSCDSHCYY